MRCTWSCRCPQIVHVAGVTIRFAEGETIHTEDSYKHTEAAFEAIATSAGWDMRAMWTDPARLFALYLLESPAASLMRQWTRTRTF